MFSSLFFWFWLFSVAQFIKHFGKYGEITDSVIMKDRKTGQPRGFGFVTYADPSVVDKVIQENHIINGKQVGLSLLSMLYWIKLNFWVLKAGCVALNPDCVWFSDHLRWKLSELYQRELLVLKISRLRRFLLVESLQQWMKVTIILLLYWWSGCVHCTVSC